MSQIETPNDKNKNEKTENFPVEKLIRPELREHVMAFYTFARAADDIGDNPLLDAADKIARLDRMGAALLDHGIMDVPSAIPLRDSLAATGVTPQHALDLLVAFKRDATKQRYENFDELLEYCRFSAAPVGRYLLDLHGVGRDSWPSNDALCAALQILNHIQDCAEDYAELDRVYIPLSLMAKHACEPTHLSREHDRSSLALRATLDDLLDRTWVLIREARKLPPQIMDKHLKIDTSVIIVIAEKLAKLLAKRDPMCDNVKLSKFDKIVALATGAIRAYMK